MLRRIANSKLTKSLHNNSQTKRAAFMLNNVIQKRFAGDSKKGDKEIEDALSYIPNRFLKSLPDDLSEALQTKKLTLTLCTSNSFILRADKVDEITLETVEYGEYGILPNHRSQYVRVLPGLLKIKYNDEKTVKWWTAGGFCFIYYNGYIQLNLAEVFKLDELDINLVRKEVEAQKELTKNRDNNIRGQAEVGLELLEPLLAALEAAEFEM
ncbi:hypothetical protein ABK040_010118 [Willaertia magna]